MSDDAEPIGYGKPFDMSALLAVAQVRLGPKATTRQLKDEMRQLALLLRRDSEFTRISRHAYGKFVDGPLISITREESSKRSVVAVKTPYHEKYNKHERDEVRTPTDWEGGQRIAEMVKTIPTGHNVRLFIVREPARGAAPNYKDDYRILDWIVDLDANDQGAVPAGVDEPAARGVAASAPSRVAHDAPFDPTQEVPVKQGPSPEQIKASRLDDPLPAEPPAEDWKRDESVAPTVAVAQSGPPTTVQRNKILDLAGHIGRADAQILAAATVGREVGPLIVKDIHSAAEAEKVVMALQSAWNDLQVERKQAKAVAS